MLRPKSQLRHRILVLIFQSKEPRTRVRYDMGHFNNIGMFRRLVVSYGPNVKRRVISGDRGLQMRIRTIENTPIGLNLINSLFC